MLRAGGPEEGREREQGGVHGGVLRRRDVRRVAAEQGGEESMAEHASQRSCQERPFRTRRPEGVAGGFGVSAPLRSCVLRPLFSEGREPPLLRHGTPPEGTTAATSVSVFWFSFASSVLPMGRGEARTCSWPRRRSPNPTGHLGLAQMAFPFTFVSVSFRPGRL